MRTALRQVFSGRRPPIPGAIAVPRAGDPWSLMALGERRPPLGRRLRDPGRQVPAHSRIVLRAGSLAMR
jgi:hypothetical protein